MFDIKVSRACKAMRWRRSKSIQFKLSVILLFAGTLQVCAMTYGQNITLNKKNVKLSAVLKEIEKQSGYHIFYDNRVVPTQEIVSVNYNNENIENVVKQLLATYNVSYSIVDKNIILNKAETPGVSSATPAGKKNTAEIQERTVTGTVRNAKGEVLKGVTVVQRNYTATTVSDDNGHYSIKAVGNTPTLLFSFVGYQTKEIQVTGSHLDIVLEENIEEVEEVVIVGYRAVKKELVNGSVATVQMADKEKQTLTHASQALYGTSGVWINQAGAKPGSDGTTIRIRGVNTLSNANPLVLLDGIEYNFNEIDPADIETITVLKDAAAAIYGSRSSNGVILITSKSGKAGKTKFDIRSHTGIQQASFLPDVVDDPILYMQMRNRAEANSGKTAVSYTQDQINEYRDGLLTDPTIYPASNWFDIAMENGWLQQHNARVSGGNQQYTFTVGGGYMYQKGIFIDNDDAKRYSFDVKVTAQATPRLKVTGGIIGNLREFNEVGYGTGTVMNTIMRALPIMSDYHRNNYYGSTWLFTPGRNNIENPRMQVEQGFTYRDYQETLTNLSLEYKLPFHITYYNTLGYRRVDHFSKDFMPQMYTVDPKTGDVRNFNGSAPRVKDWDSLDKQFTLSHRLVYEQQLGDHQLHAMLGQDYQVNDARNFQAYNWGFYDNSLYELNALSDQTNAQATGYSAMSKLASVYSRLAYDYRGKYMVEGTLRYDGSSRFAPGNQWSFFPSMSVGWLISREDFFRSQTINMLKFRASIGKLGNQAVSIGAYNSTVNISNAYNYSFGGTTDGGAAITALTDRNIRWESTLSYNAGLDMSLWNKLNLTADYFYKRTFDILRPITIPGQIGGLTGPTVNLGKVDNKGWELGANFSDKKGDIDYGINGSVSYVKNKVVDIAGQQVISGRYIIKEGYSINSYYLYDALGYYQTQTEIDDAQAVYGTRSKLRPGYIKYANINNDNFIDDEDKIITGSTIPDYTYGFGARVGYKNVVLDAQFQGVANVDVYPAANVAMPFNNGAGVTYDWARESWTPDHPNAKLPLLTTFTDANENFINSTFWLRDASYLRMKNISLTYNVSDRWLKTWGGSKLAVYISGQNLWTISKFKMWDPELTTTKGDLYEYPNLKSYSVGLNLTF
ncbi:TonB-dependent receptor [Sphingobacterium sp. SGG-5]|uniref:TonB-dependent receptor n=1 Tax=Sphingobacterium sp. SGG-5 TaxID=2710881 RepID=UPI0013ECEAC2|nr:TonB-dependent receptor [Sphingobacterium sp. SGG-5]NGM61170.1 TonB-dependent receptor [Sphingobacterium sp. SGG-5]